MNDMPFKPSLAGIPAEDQDTLPLPAGLSLPSIGGSVAMQTFTWPVPPLAQYERSAAPPGPEPCEIVGLNGHLMQGRMTYFDPASAALYLQLPPSRTTMLLRFDQFRCIRLTEPLLPRPGATGLDQLSVLPYTVHLYGAAPAQGLTVRHVETDDGLFLFEPVDGGPPGALRRCFFPREAFERYDVGLPVAHTDAEASPGTDIDIEFPELVLPDAGSARDAEVDGMPIHRLLRTPEELVEAIEAQARMPIVRIGQALLALGMISREQLDEALAQQRVDRGMPLGEILVRSGHVSRQDLQTALSRKMGFPAVDVDIFPVDVAAVARLPFAVARRLAVLPLMTLGGRLVVAMEDPTQRSALEELEFAGQCKIVPVLARLEDLPRAVDRAYERIGARGASTEPTAIPEADTEDPNKLLATLELQQVADDRETGLDERPIEQSDNSLVRLINSMILEARQQGVSDIHIECQPGREKVKVRFRRDGVLRTYMELPPSYRHAMIARLKIMSDLDIADRRKPQDGKISFGRYMPGQTLELRLATIPTQAGLEDAVLRLLSSAKLIPLEDINLSPRNLQHLKEAVHRPFGMILCVGPTGSGKTTTLHSAIGHINTADRKIWTAEDPIEITQRGLRQVQVNPKIDWTFARAMRAFLRADPDVIMVGEIRDHETAQVAIEASLTGHLVLSTLHTNSAPETVTRLIDMGMDPFNFADSLLAVLGQRLVRRLCTACRTTREATPEEVRELLDEYLALPRDLGLEVDPSATMADWMARFGTNGKLMRCHSPGCDRCERSGFRGRTAIHELLTVSRHLRHLIQTRARTDELLRCALADGMRTLRQDGIEKVLAGDTSIEEVRANSY